VTEVRVDIDQGAIDAMCSDWTSPVGQYIERVTAEVHQAATDTAPVSDRGSKYFPPGYLRGRVSIAHQHDDAGVILGLVGVPIKAGRGGNRAPLMFIANAAGRTANRGRRSYRNASNRFLLRALQEVTGESVSG
jgi:hypothetical protein